jgi:hydrophobic/amphiphilic exporter-1 (mainly G- bacteria), HAE1 family
MQLINFCIRYPVTVLVGIILALMFGIIAVQRLPLQMTPTVDRPEITVETTYTGAAPQERHRRPPGRKTQCSPKSYRDRLDLV